MVKLKFACVEDWGEMESLYFAPLRAIQQFKLPCMPHKSLRAQTCFTVDGMIPADNDSKILSGTDASCPPGPNP